MKQIFRILAFLAFVVVLTGCPHVNGGGTPNDINNDAGGGTSGTGTGGADAGGDADDKTITFNVSYESEHGIAPETITVNKDSVLSSEELGKITCEGYAFSGWFDGTTEAKAGEYTVTKDVVLKAAWKELYPEIIGEWEIGDNNFFSPRYIFTDKTEDRKHIIYAYAMRAKNMSTSLSSSNMDYDYILNVLKGYYAVQEDIISIEFTDYLKDNAWVKIENAADGDLVEYITNLWHSNTSYSISQSGILTIDGVTCKSSFTSTESRLLGNWEHFHFNSNSSTHHTFSLNPDNTYVEESKNGTYSVITDYPDNKLMRN